VAPNRMKFWCVLETAVALLTQIYNGDSAQSDFNGGTLFTSLFLLHFQL